MREEVKNWYASVNFGLEETVAGIIKKYGATNVNCIDSAILFDAPHELNLNCINNLFLILTEYESESIEIAARILVSKRVKFPEMQGRTFRVIYMDSGKLEAVPENVVDLIEKKVTAYARIQPHRANPDIEIWLNRRNDGKVYFMVRTHKHPDYNKQLRKGELRPEIVDIMLHLSKINRKSIVVDLFGGWGSIAHAVAQAKLYEHLYTGDINDECVHFQKQRLKSVKRSTVQKWDGLNTDLENNSIDAIITDPPWGEYENININKFYPAFIKEAARVLKPGGKLVFLSSAQVEAGQALSQYHFVTQFIPLKINGKNTYMFVAMLTAQGHVREG
ncbi:MAG: methyltransferase [Defluviitaleaceae bacterium]|nr:methyltransferase [Defluviitaleaceae bacterium]MCL2274382.1 methyltransferase [Defluviitaleaceae bacterium]